MALKIWKTKASDGAFAGQLASELNLPPIVANVLSGYGFADIEAAARFLSPRLKNTSDPFLIPQMEAAVLRIWRAIAARETILIYGDYDVDGIASTVLVSQVLRRLGMDCIIPCLPDRQEEGYGLNVAALQRCIKQIKPQLIVTVDCGITALEAAQFAKKEGIDLIVTDHHEVGEKLPDTLATVNPKLGKIDSIKTLSGVGVAFKVCHALLKHGRAKGYQSAEIDLTEYLDLVALGTVADLVPLLEENRVFVHHGLKQINCSRSPAWSAIKNVAALKGPLDTYHLAFCIAPRLNAAGRLGTAETALELLMTDDKERVKTIAGQLDKANRERQTIEAQILKEAVAEISGYFDPAVHYGIVVGSRSWHIGVIGIVASRLVARYNRPVVVIGFDENGMGRGSGRSIEGYNLLHGLSACAAGLTGWGGHEMAAGMDIEEKNLDAFRKHFNEAVLHELKDKNLCPVQRINSWIGLDDVSEENYNALERLAPFGQSNPKPVFAARNVKITAPPRVVGGKHLRFSVSNGKGSLNAIAFNRAEGATGMADRKLADDCVDIAFHIRKNSFNGSERLELNVLDLKPAGTGEGDT